MTVPHPLTTTPTVSVILTSFNHAKFLSEAIESVLNQKYTNFELIIWDDCSTDDSDSIIKSYVDQRIKYFRNDTNKGPTFGVNEAIYKHSAAMYIAIHHSDDVWLPHKLGEQVNFLETNAEVGAVFSFADAINEAGEKLPPESHIYSTIFQQSNRSRQAWLKHFLLSGNALCHPSVLIRKECYAAVGRYRQDLFQLPDFEMWIRLCCKFEIHVIQKPLIHFRLLDGERNTSGTRPETIRRTAYEMLCALNTLKENLSLLDLAKIFPEHEDGIYAENNIGLSIAKYLSVARPYPAADLFILNEIRSHLAMQTTGFATHQNWPQLRDMHMLSGELDVFGYNFQRRLSDCQYQLAAANSQIDAINSELTNTKMQLDLITIQRNNLFNSTSWRVTKPFRWLRRYLSTI